MTRQKNRTGFALRLGGALGGCALVAGLLAMGPFAPHGQRSTEQEHMAARAAFDGHVSGSAFAVAPDLVITNAHVTLRCRVAGLPLTVDGQGGWRIVREDPTTELTLLQGPANAELPALRLSAAPQLAHATPVLLLGYPLKAGSFDHLHAARGEIDRAALTVHRPEAGTSVSFTATDTRGQAIDPSWADGVAYFGARNTDRLRWILEIAAPTGHGDSGGPVVDGDGNVVGVIFAGSPARNTASAVTLDDLRDFLLRADVTPQFAPPAEGRPDWQHALNHAAPSVVRVGC